MECFVAYVHYEDISWRWDVELKSEPLVISQKHLIMRQVNFYICIGHFSLSLYNIQHSIRIRLRSYYIATTSWLAAATCLFALAHKPYNNIPLTFGLVNRAGAERRFFSLCHCNWRQRRSDWVVTATLCAAGVYSRLLCDFACSAGRSTKGSLLLQIA